MRVKPSALAQMNAGDVYGESLKKLTAAYRETDTEYGNRLWNAIFLVLHERGSLISNESAVRIATEAEHAFHAAFLKENGAAR